MNSGGNLSMGNIEQNHLLFSSNTHLLLGHDALRTTFVDHACMKTRPMNYQFQIKRLVSSKAAIPNFAMMRYTNDF